MRLIDADELYQNIDTTLNPYDKPSLVVKQEMLERINLAPTVEPKHGEWIPVSERLPEEDEDIIITHLGNMKKPIVDVSYFDGDFRSEDGEAYFSEVIAWMPLPEPYKRGEAE